MMRLNQLRWILIYPFFMGLARAQEEAVDLGGMEGKPSWNPYSFTRNPYFLAVPIIGMILLIIHLYRRDRSKSSKKTAEVYFND